MEHIDKLNTPVDKFKFIIHTICEEDDVFSVSPERIDDFRDDPDLPLIKEKINNLMNLMSEYQKNGNLDELMHKDIENDIWLLI